MSHDLKTPLALIQLFAETLELGRVRTPDRAQEYYRIINGESKKLTRLIENILDFSRMEAGLRPYRMEPADLAESVTKVLARMEHAVRAGPFHRRDCDRAGLPHVLADEGAAEQAIENLLANAMKYSGEHREIEVEARRADGHIVVAVTRPRHRHLAARAGPDLPQVLSRAARARRRTAGHRPRPGDRRSHHARPRRLRAASTSEPERRAAPSRCTSPFRAITRSSLTLAESTR